jgi:SAM-dependent methyltransferase
MTNSDRQSHWQNVYASKGESEVSWFEETPAVSLELIRMTGTGKSSAIIDVGGGASRLVDALGMDGYCDLTVLDLSSRALDVARARLGKAGLGKAPLGAAADAVRWIADDVTHWTPDRAYDLWHDRAAFHFLIEPADQQAYARCVARAVKPGGHVIIGTVAPDGPERCSGLPVRRSDSESIGKILGPSFERIHSRPYRHRTPGGASQNFQFGIFRKAG